MRMANPITSAISLAMTLVFTVSAEAVVYGDDPRRQVSPEENPIYQRVGIITKAGTDEILGTAWLSGECQITAAYHSVFFKERKSLTDVVTFRGKKGFAVDFHIGLNPGKAKTYKKTVRAEVVDFGNYMPKDTVGMFEDYAHLKLSECVGKDLGYLEVKPNSGSSTLPTDELMVVGFHQDRYFNQPGITVEEGCRAQDRSISGGGVAINCSTMPMCSGCPVLEKQGGAYRVVGMINAGAPVLEPVYTPDSPNWMVHSDVFSDSLIKARGEEIPPHILRARATQPKQSDSSTKLANAPRSVVR